MLALNRNKEAEELLMSEPRTPTSLAFYVKGLARQGNHAAALDMFEKIKQLQKGICLLVALCLAAHACYVEGGSFFQHDAQMALVTALWLMGHRDEALYDILWLQLGFSSVSDATYRSILETALKDASRFSAIRELLEGSIDLAGHTGSLNILWPIITRFGEQDPFSYNPYLNLDPSREHVLILLSQSSVVLRSGDSGARTERTADSSEAGAAPRLDCTSPRQYVNLAGY